MTTILVVVGVLLALALLIGWLIVTYNRLVRRRNQVDADWAQVDVQLMRRYDLVDNLVQTVKGYASHEKSTLDAVTQARSQAFSAQGPAAKAQADSALSGALFNLFALSEAYPDLKASGNFLSLQEELANTENRIAHARQFYNDAVVTYHNDIHAFPTLIIARMMGFGEREFFRAEEAARPAPRVQF